MKIRKFFSNHILTRQRINSQNYFSLSRYAAERRNIMGNNMRVVNEYEIGKSYDVIVTGGGVAGVAAAVSAAKFGASVLLIEKSNILGGLATLGQVNYFVPMCNGYGKQIIYGLAEKWLRDSAQYGYDTIPNEWKNGEPESLTKVRYVQRYSPYIFAFQLTEEIRKSGSDILFDCMAVRPVMEGNVCKGVLTESKSGGIYHGCKVLIDTTGDSDMLRRMGIPTKTRGNFFTYWCKKITLDGCREAYEKGDIKYAYGSIYGGNINLFGDNQPNDVPMWEGVTVEEVTDYLITNQLKLLENIKTDDRRSRDIAMIPMMPQFRTTRRIVGDYTFKVDAYKHFEDSICAINDFEHRGHLFEVPYRTICRSDFPNVLTAGRSASGEGYGWDLIRVIPPAILTGQAAGLAAAQSVKEKNDVAKIDIKTLQNSLEGENVMIHFPDSYVPEDKSVIIHGKNASSDGEHI